MVQLLLDLIVNVQFTVILEKVEMRRQPEIRQGCTVEVVLQLQYFL
jgi:hypothetical protein